MKRIIPYALLTTVLVTLLWTPAGTATYTYVVRELSQTFTALQTFGAGLTVSAGELSVEAGAVSVAADQRVNLDGPLGDDYLTRNSDTGFVNIYVDGTLKATVTPSGVIPGECPDDIYAMELGTQCMSDGDLIIVNKEGPWRF